jgi:hypothetical protein
LRRGAASLPAVISDGKEQVMSLRQRLRATAALAVVIAVSSALAGGGAFSRYHDAAAATASAGALCVGGKPGCFATIQAAVDAASDGDVIKIGPGTYAGGVTIDVSVALVGAGPERTIIRGGGPVLTIGTFGAETEPDVLIDGVTITGGVTRSSPESLPFTGQEGVFAVGGGVEIPPNADFSGGAKVAIVNSVITRNRVAPSDTAPFGPPCPDGPCAFAFAGGGGIDSWGTLALKKTTVSDNRVGSASGLSALASDANGGAITNWLGPLTISGSVIDGNRASATGPNGRFAEGGAIMAFGGTLDVRNSVVTDNGSELAASLPNSVEQLANGGAMHITSGVRSASIQGTIVSGNSVTMTNTAGDANAFSGGVHVDLDVDFHLTSSVIADNQVVSRTLRGSQGDAFGDSGAGELLGTIRNSRLSGNRVTASSDAGNASALAGAAIFTGSMTNSLVNGNHITASSPVGSVEADGGGLVVDTPGMTLRNTPVTQNAIDANGASGSARGGGIFDAPIPNGPPGGPLVLVNSDVTGNVLTGGPGITLLGGGLYIQDEPLTLAHSQIAHNVPDDCFGC